MIDWKRVVILSGPSGVGKDTVLDAWMAADPRIGKVITCTTRQPRTGEVHGVHYMFLEPDTFEELLDKGAFLEAMPVHDHWYATPLDQIAALQEQGGVAVLRIDVQGAARVRTLHPEVISIFILPPSNEELERRLRGRGTDSDATIRRRLEVARGEIERASEYTHRVVNDDVTATLKQIMEWVP